MQNTDGKGRPAVEDMTDREIIAEILVILRAGADAVEELSQSPMLAAMGIGGGGGMDPVTAALMSRG